MKFGHQENHSLYQQILTDGNNLSDVTQSFWVKTLEQMGNFKINKIFSYGCSISKLSLLSLYTIVGRMPRTAYITQNKTK